jgi:hypothetical protein
MSPAADRRAAVAALEAILRALTAFRAEAKRAGCPPQLMADLGRVDSIICLLAFTDPVVHLQLDLVDFAGAYLLSNVPELLTPIRNASSQRFSSTVSEGRLTGLTAGARWLSRLLDPCMAWAP